VFCACIKKQKVQAGRIEPVLLLYFLLIAQKNKVPLSLNPQVFRLIPNNAAMPKALKEEKPPEDQEAFFTVKQVYE
jgi:P pilus assembly chaperone PapD